MTEKDTVGMVPYGVHGLLIPERALPKRLERKIPLEPIWSQQVDRLLSLGFHEELGITEEAYRVSIPTFLDIPREKNFGYFDLPLVVDPRVKPSKQMESVVVKDKIGRVDNIIDAHQQPYTMWGRIYEHPRVSYRGAYENTYLDLTKLFENIQTFEVGGTFIEVISMFLQYPQLFQNGKKHSAESYDLMFAPGSRTRQLALPALDYSNEEGILYEGQAYLPRAKFHTYKHVGLLTRSLLINTAPNTQRIERK